MYVWLGNSFICNQPCMWLCINAICWLHIILLSGDNFHHNQLCHVYIGILFAVANPGCQDSEYDRRKYFCGGVTIKPLYLLIFSKLLSPWAKSGLADAHLLHHSLPANNLLRLSRGPDLDKILVDKYLVFYCVILPNYHIVIQIS